MEGVVINRPVALVCTGYGTHPTRELVVLIPVHPRRDLTLMRREAGIPEPEPTPDELRGFGVEGSLWTQESWGPRKERHKTEAALVNTPGVGWQVVAPGCPTCCQKALSEPVGRIVLHVTTHCPPGASRVDVDLRPPPSGTKA